MGDPTGFLYTDRKTPQKMTVSSRIKSFSEFYLDWPASEGRDQAARCMNCAVPFCMKGCPLGNIIPDWNDLVYRGMWEEALRELHSTNNFPDFTGRICPAPCEESCVLNINQDPVTIEHIERTISDHGWENGWIKPLPPEKRTGKKVAVVGSGPAGLAAAQQLNRAGHFVTLFEKDNYIGGILRLGIPDFKLEKSVIQRRVDQMEAEGVEFRTNTYIGRDLPVQEIVGTFDAICLTAGSTIPRNLDVEGRELGGIHFAMDYLTQQNRILSGETIEQSSLLTAKGKRVVILGGGDTGSDCLGTAHRQGAKEVWQIELLPKPPLERNSEDLWPNWPMTLRTSSSQEEGGTRDYSILTKGFSGRSGKVRKLHCIRLKWGQPGPSGRSEMQEISGSEFEIDVDLVLLALGFLHPDPKGLVQDLALELDVRGNVKTDVNKMTNIEGVFAAGDMSRGQSLVVWALAEGREAARGIDQYLMGETWLPRSLSNI